MLHHHHHPSPASNKTFFVGACINILYVLIEAYFGFVADSLSLLADAGHNLSDVLILLLAWGANLLASVKPTSHHTYGYRRATILAAMVSGVTLVITMVFIAIEAIERLNNLVEPNSILIVLVAGSGVIINSITAALFFKSISYDLNVKGAFLHMVADALVSLAVVIGGLVIYFTGWLLIDPLLSLVIILAIAYSAWGLLRDSFNLSVDAVPEGIDIVEIRKFLLSLPDVTDIQDLHVWAMSTTQVALTAHLLRNVKDIDDEFLHQAATELKLKYGVDHPTIQIENGDQN